MIAYLMAFTNQLILNNFILVAEGEKKRKEQREKFFAEHGAPRIHYSHYWWFPNAFIAEQVDKIRAEFQEQRKKKREEIT